MKHRIRIASAKALAALLSFALLLFATACNTSGDSSSGSGSGSTSTSATTGTAATSLEKTTFNLGHLNSTAHLFAFVAKEEGFFEEEGLSVTLNQFASSADLVAGLLSGQLDVSFIGSVPTITNAQDKDISVFGGAMSNGHGYVIKPELTAGKEKDITVLKGNTVASVKNSIQDVELLILLQKAGLTYGDSGDVDVTIKYFSSQKDAYNALKSGEIDAASAYSPYTSIAKNDGYEVIYYCNDVEEFHNQPCCRQVAATQALKDAPNSYTAFERALIKAYKFSQENKEKTIADVGKYIQIPAEDIEFEVYGGHALSYPDPDKRATEQVYQQLIGLNYTVAFDFMSHYDTDLYQAALDSLLAESPNDPIYKELKEHFTSSN